MPILSPRLPDVSREAIYVRGDTCTVVDTDQLSSRILEIL
jgi:hypothetical protein